MGLLLELVGLGWALIGVANLIMMPWATIPTGSPLATIGLIFNMLAFVLPGLIVAGIGYRIRNKQAPPPTAAPIYRSHRAAGPSSAADRMSKLDELRAQNLITESEYQEKRRAILGEV